MGRTDFEHLDIKGRQAIVWAHPQLAPGAAGPLVVMPGGEDMRQQLDALLPMVTGAGANGCAPFRLACFSSEDWDSDYTPWAAPALAPGGAPFEGRAADTLEWLQRALLPAIAKHTGTPPLPQSTALLGYSLAGLFALWAFYQSGLFAAAGSCSGSLWYNGWANYATGCRAPAGSRVYLSLGEKEEKARNPRMAAVGDATRGMAALLRQDPNVAQTVLEWHPGGHFTDVPRRIARALAWLVRP